MRFRTRYIGPSLGNASGLAIGRTSLMVRNRDRLVPLNQTAYHDYSATIDRGNLPFSDDVAGGTSVTLYSGNGIGFMAYGPTYVFLGGMPILLNLDAVEPPDYTYGIFTTPSLVEYYNFLGLTPPSLTSGQQIDVTVTVANAYGFDTGYEPYGEVFSWIKF